MRAVYAMNVAASVSAKLIATAAITAIGALASTQSWVGPTTVSGTPCIIGSAGCVMGGDQYDIFGAQLTQPTVGDPLWTLTIETNYPAAITGNTIPPAEWGVDLLLYSISDFLISWNGNDYGIVLAQHIKGSNPVDSYVAGGLYQAPNILQDLVLSGTNNTHLASGVLPDSPRPNFPVWLAPGGTQLGTGTITVAQTGSGTPAQYTITARFTAPDTFLASGVFTIDASSWVCANGIITGSGNFTSPSEVREPRTMGLAAAGLILLFGLGRALRQ